jgi:hypothetical protein
VGVFASAPSWPFGKLAIVPHQEPGRREQCRDCAGGGEINGLECCPCDGRGWFDADNPPPPER